MASKGGARHPQGDVPFFRTDDLAWLDPFRFGSSLVDGSG